jgi:hypothetical protein
MNVQVEMGQMRGTGDGNHPWGMKCGKREGTKLAWINISRDTMSLLSIHIVVGPNTNVQCVMCMVAGLVRGLSRRGDDRGPRSRHGLYGGSRHIMLPTPLM